MLIEFEFELEFVVLFKALPHLLHGLRAARLNSPGFSCLLNRLNK